MRLVRGLGRSHRPYSGRAPARRIILLDGQEISMAARSNQPPSWPKTLSQKSLAGKDGLNSSVQTAPRDGAGPGNRTWLVQRDMSRENPRLLTVRVWIALQCRA